jgi:hypothetical protein
MKKIALVIAVVFLVVVVLLVISYMRSGERNELARKFGCEIPVSAIVIRSGYVSGLQSDITYFSVRFDKQAWKNWLPDSPFCRVLQLTHPQPLHGLFIDKEQQLASWKIADDELGYGGFIDLKTGYSVKYFICEVDDGNIICYFALGGE